MPFLSAEASGVPRGLHAAPTTDPPCPLSIDRSSPVVESGQRFIGGAHETDTSPLDETARCLCSGKGASTVVASSCATDESIAPESVDQRCMTPSAPPAATTRLSGLMHGRAKFVPTRYVAAYKHRHLSDRVLAHAEHDGGYQRA